MYFMKGILMSERMYLYRTGVAGLAMTVAAHMFANVQESSKRSSEEGRRVEEKNVKSSPTKELNSNIKNVDSKDSKNKPESNKNRAEDTKNKNKQVAQKDTKDKDTKDEEKSLRIINETQAHLQSNVLRSRPNVRCKWLLKMRLRKYLNALQWQQKS